MANRGRNIFNSVKLKRPGRSTFNLSHDVKMSGKLGDLYPTMVVEAIPGDNFKIGCDAMVRFAPLLAPVMHRFNFFQHYFFVPSRILWDNFEDFITNNDDPPPVMPYIELTSALTDAEKSFLDYMGIPPITGANTVRVNALSLAAYQRIYYEYYRDQNLQDTVPEIILTDGDNAANLAELLTLRQRNLEHDYFTAALPFAQKGNAVDIPLGDVMLKDDWLPDEEYPFFDTGSDSPTNAGGPINTIPPTMPFGPMVSDANSDPVAYNPNGSLTVQPTTINDLRRAFRLQEWLERNALGGTRYIEHILAHFGVRSSDARLQNPEYIGGTKMPIMITEVLNTTGLLEIDGEDTGVPQANMAGHGLGMQKIDKYANFFCEEHGYIIGVMSVLPRTAYQQGVPKHYLKHDFLDYAFPEFANLGEQALLKEEVYIDTADLGGTFGYVPRYSEYKFMQSRIAGEFRNTLDFWHAGRIFGSEPALNSDLITCNYVDYSRIFAVEENVDHLYIQIVHNVLASRLLPFYGTPTI